MRSKSKVVQKPAHCRFWVGLNEQTQFRSQWTKVHQFFFVKTLFTACQ